MTTSGSNLPEPVPEGRETRASRKGKSCSRDLISALHARMSRVEVAVGDMRDRLDVQEEHVEELNGRDEELKGEVQEMVREMLENVAERNSQLESVATGISTDDRRITVASMYLGDTALLWWRCRYDDRLGGAPVRTWIDFQTELRKQFYPEYAMDEARGKLRRLVQKGDVREYVREFSELALQVGDLGEREALFTFMDGLKPWAKQELQRRGVQDLTLAMAVAEGLIDYSRSDKDRTEPAKPKDKGKGWADKGKQSRDKERGDGKPPSKWKSKSTWKGKSSGSKEDKPKRLKTAGKRAKGLMYADLLVAGQQVEALVDTGASDLFVSEQAAIKLGIKTDRACGWVKTVNSKRVRTKGVAKGVDVQLRQWHGAEDIEVIPMDDYEAVVGVRFLEQIKAIPIPHSDCLCILDPKGQCVVPIRRGRVPPNKALSAIQLAKGVRKGEQTFAVVLSLEDTPGSVVEAPVEEGAAGRGAGHKPLGEPTLTAPGRQSVRGPVQPARPMP
ncbi:Uncharacterized protein TCM_033493 [Theobroma cacao]|uniref:Retrotransposon gag domain-containing protein n=1 Tax=Theobroma cacao TaxID=3641 RepID=A0A061FBE9_THECC|nr:Uncharacterized protein TCM_033493 [Theobroma cacao]